jgi:chorismate dehydratase
MRYALISFLNARPLWWGLTHRPAEGESFEFTSPARCADLVVAGEADLGLVPAIELARVEGLVAIPSICIASRSEVRSVLMVSRVPFEEIRSVALDPSSRTSIALARILLAERAGEERYRAMKFDAVEPARLTSFEGHDAAVVIGDPALLLSRISLPEPLYRYDLVSEWNALYGEPFVFAVWAGRRDRLQNEGIQERLAWSLRYGRERIEEIVAGAAEELALPASELRDYFERALHYELGAAEMAALARFHRLAGKYGLTEREKEIEWMQPRLSIGS